ncbi:DUF6682 family protein [Paraburkholderia hospita]|uniref:phage adaptor protein n=1 Tax=Paraburkholderia hospita TaxID=169430 RepID=UPI0008A7D0A0|nr:DUF6682 family protein [Paraburkholderia hospita]SEH89736.1 hypothetical protein SAMN05192544_1011144 [Paraburkholderia hospita]
MPILAADLITRAGEILLDEEHLRWKVPELLNWINDAARETIVHRPASGSISAALVLGAGTLQALPANAVELLDVVRNLGADGTTPGRSIRRVDRQLLDDQDPDWHSARAKNVIKHYTFDERAPSTFYVYPPAVAGTKVEAMYSRLPPDVAAEGDSLDMSPEYINALVSYIVFRAMSKDSEYANGQTAALHYQAFLGLVGDQAAQATANSPNAVSQ